MTSFIPADGSGRSTSVIPARPAGSSLTTIAFIRHLSYRVDAPPAGSDTESCSFGSPDEPALHEVDPEAVELRQGRFVLNAFRDRLQPEAMGEGDDSSYNGL